MAENAAAIRFNYLHYIFRQNGARELYEYMYMIKMAVYPMQFPLLFLADA